MNHDLSASRPRDATPEVQAHSQANGPSERGADALVLTTSRVGTFMACPRRHWWAYELGIRPDRDGVALSIGRAYHAGLESINRGATVGSLDAGAIVAGLDAVDAAIVLAMIGGWAWRWSAAPAVRRVLAVEQVFHFAPVPGADWTVAGKIDAIGELADGRVAVVEYKTTRESVEPASDYWRRLLIDRQISGYVMGARAIGYPVDTVVYDAARVPGLRPRLTSRKPGAARESVDEFAKRLNDDITGRANWYYGRTEIQRLESDLEQWREDMAHVAEMMGLSKNTGRWPRNTDACMRWGKCPYFAPCSSCHDPQTAGLPAGYRKVENVHQELVTCTIDGIDGSEPDDADTATE